MSRDSEKQWDRRKRIFGHLAVTKPAKQVTANGNLDINLALHEY
jgi:hypothetical protein